jgi:hypothetical protein
VAKGFNLLGRGVTAGSAKEKDRASRLWSKRAANSGVSVTLKPVGYANLDSAAPPSLKYETSP